MSTVTIPNTQFIGVNIHRSSDGSMPLGFLTPGGTNAGAKKRISTVISWVGADSALRHNIKPEDSAQFMLDNPTATMVRDTTDNQQECFRWYHYEIPKVEDEDYKLYDNVPNEARIGFRITKSISRGSSWNGGNKVVRIEDPRGFELEISVDNLVKMMSMCTFVGGVCQEACVWGRMGAANILLPVTSDEYKEAVKVTDYRAKETISLRDVTFGDTVELKKTEQFQGLTGEYMGAYHVYSLQKLYKSKEALAGNYNYNKKNDFTFMKSHKRYVIRIKDKYFGVSGCKIHKIINKVDVPVERPDLTADNYKDLTYGQVGTIVCLTTKKIPVVDVVSTVEFLPTTDLTVINEQDSGSAAIWAKNPKNGKMMMFNRAYHSVHYNSGKDYESDEERLKLFQGDVTEIDISNNNWYVTEVLGEGGKGPFNILKNPLAKAALSVDNYLWYQLAFTVNGMVRRVPVVNVERW